MVKPCCGIDCTNIGKQKCGGCKLRDYCSKACQHTDWIRHKTFCKNFRKTTKETINEINVIKPKSRVIDGIKYKKKRGCFASTEGLLVCIQLLSQAEKVCKKYNIDSEVFMEWTNKRDQNTNEPVPIAFTTLNKNTQVTFFVELYEVYDIDVQSPTYTNNPNVVEIRMFGNTAANQICRAWKKVLDFVQLKKLENLLVERGIGDLARQKLKKVNKGKK